MANILLLYSTTDGHTRKICQKIQARLEQQDHMVHLVSIIDTSPLDLEAFDKIIIGASIRYGKHNKNVFDFIQRHQAVLHNKSSAFFSVNVVARKPGKDQPDTNPYVKKFLQQVPWQPNQVAVFAGKIDYQKYRFVDRQMIRLIMYLTHGPTDLHSVNEFTNWQRVDDFAMTIANM